MDDDNDFVIIDVDEKKNTKEILWFYKLEIKYRIKIF